MEVPYILFLILLSQVCSAWDEICDEGTESSSYRTLGYIDATSKASIGVTRENGETNVDEAKNWNVPKEELHKSFTGIKVNGRREGRPIGAYELVNAMEELGAGEILQISLIVMAVL